MNSAPKKVLTKWMCGASGPPFGAVGATAAQSDFSGKTSDAGNAKGMSHEVVGIEVVNLGGDHSASVSSLSVASSSSRFG